MLELCSGARTPFLHAAYTFQNLQVTGNDIKNKYETLYPKCKWVIGDCLSQTWHAWSGFDTIVFRPPFKPDFNLDTSKPSYKDFINDVNYKDKLAVCVFPGHILDQKKSRKQVYKFLAFCQDKRWLKDYAFMAAMADREVKYWELYLDFRPKKL